MPVAGVATHISRNGEPVNIHSSSCILSLLPLSVDLKIPVAVLGSFLVRHNRGHYLLKCQKNVSSVEPHLHTENQLIEAWNRELMFWVRDSYIGMVLDIHKLRRDPSSSTLELNSVNVVLLFCRYLETGFICFCYDLPLHIHLLGCLLLCTAPFSTSCTCFLLFSQGSLEESSGWIYFGIGFISVGSSIAPDKNIFSSLSIVKNLLLLAASKDGQRVTALLTEFRNGSKDVLEDIGQSCDDDKQGLINLIILMAICVMIKFAVQCQLEVEIVPPFEALSTTDSEASARYGQALGNASSNVPLEESSFQPLSMAPTSSQQQHSSQQDRNSMAARLRRQNNGQVKVIHSARGWPTTNSASSSSSNSQALSTENYGLVSLGNCDSERGR